MARPRNKDARIKFLDWSIKQCRMGVARFADVEVRKEFIDAEVQYQRELDALKIEDQVQDDDLPQAVGFSMQETKESKEEPK